MLVEISRFIIDVDPVLVSITSEAVLQPYLFDNKQCHSPVITVAPLLNSPEKFIDTEHRLNNLYREENDSIVVANKHSICRFEKDRRAFYIAPGRGFNDPVYDVVTDLKFLVSELAIEAGGVMFHCAGVIHKGKCILLTGPSGAGKSTLAQSLRTSLQVINDEIVIILPLNGHFLAYSSPFGDSAKWKRLESGMQVDQVFMLRKSLACEVVTIEPKDSLMAVLGGVCMFPTTEDRAQKMFDNVIEFHNNISCNVLSFSKNSTVESVVTLFEKEW